MTLINATPHDIHIYAASDASYDALSRKLIINDGTTPRQIVPPSGVVLSAKSAEQLSDEVDGIPVKAVVWTADPLPAGDEIYIVSALYKSAAPEQDKHRLLTVGGTVYAGREDPRPVGCTYLQR